MSDLVGGKYPQYYSLPAAMGGLVNATQANVPARTNAEWFGYSALSDGALAASGVGCFVPVPVDPGQTISKVSILVGATAASTPTHSFAALYQGTGTAPALIGQSTDITTGAIAASALFGWTLTTAVTITSTHAPNGFVYALISQTATAVSTAASVSTPAGINYQWNGTVSPLFLSGTAGSALAGTAAATIASGAAKTVAPIVFLT